MCVCVKYDSQLYDIMMGYNPDEFHKLVTVRCLGYRRNISIQRTYDAWDHGDPTIKVKGMNPMGMGCPTGFSVLYTATGGFTLKNRNKSIGIIWNNHTLGWKCNTFESTNRSWHVNLVSQKHLSKMFCSNKISGQNFTIICGKPLSYTALHQSTCHVSPWSTLWAAACL